MAETIEEKTTSNVQEFEFPTQEKLRVPPQYPPKRTEAEGAQLDLGIQERDKPFILVLIHPQTRHAQSYLANAKNRITYKFHTLSVEELCDTFVKSITTQPMHLKKRPPSITICEYVHSFSLQEEIYHAAAELHRTFQ